MSWVLPEAAALYFRQYFIDHGVFLGRFAQRGI
jgi:hypothetical protein